MMSGQPAVKPRVRVHDPLIDELLADESLDEKFPGLRKALQYGDTTMDNPPLDDDEDDDGGPARGVPQWGFDPKWLVQPFIRLIVHSMEQYPEYQEARQKLSPELLAMLDRFMSGEPADSLFSHPGTVSAAHFDAAAPLSTHAAHHFQQLHSYLKPHRSREGSTVKVAENLTFQNWGRTVQNVPSKTYVVTKIADLQDIVREAKQSNTRVRAAGYRHTWTNIFSEDHALFVSMLDLDTVNKLPNMASIEKTPDYSDNDFKQICVTQDPDVPGSAFVRLGAAVTNEDFRRWAIDPKNGNWTLVVNVIMVEITFGGSNAPICHGAGLRSQTLSDLVVEVEYVDANGEIRQVSDPRLIKAASGCFGLLGIVTNITLRVSAMSYALFDPKTTDLLLAIPPPPSMYDRLPEDLRERLDQYDAATLAKAKENFIEIASKRFYSEWFWFPYQKEVFINSWDTTTDPTNMINYPRPFEVFLQWLFTWGGGILNSLAPFKLLPPKYQAAIMGYFAMLTMPSKPVKTQLINALHFRRGIQNMRVGDFEVEIPIPAKEKASSPTQTTDWELVQRAWWDAIIAMVNHKEKSPVRIALEMRITGDSNVTMAPQRGNKFGTASIEVVTSMPAVENTHGIWKNFKQTLADIWLGYTDPDGNVLAVRPHWAKEWTETKAFNQDWAEYLRTHHYKEPIQEFKALLAEVGSKQHWTIEDLKERFSNPLLDRLIFAD